MRRACAGARRGSRPQSLGLSLWDEKERRRPDCLRAFSASVQFAVGALTSALSVGSRLAVLGWTRCGLAQGVERS